MTEDIKKALRKALLKVAERVRDLYIPHGSDERDDSATERQDDSATVKETV